MLGLGSVSIYKGAIPVLSSQIVHGAGCHFEGNGVSRYFVGFQQVSPHIFHIGCVLKSGMPERIVCLLVVLQNDPKSDTLKTRMHPIVCFWDSVEHNGCHHYNFVGCPRIQEEFPYARLFWRVCAFHCMDVTLFHRLASKSLESLCQMGVVSLASHYGLAIRLTVSHARLIIIMVYLL